MESLNIKHYKTCNAKYPEKVRSEKPREIKSIDLYDGLKSFFCVDCGSSVVFDGDGNEVSRDI